MNKQLIEAMASGAEFSKRIEGDIYIEGYATDVIQAINDAGFVVVPKEPTKDMALSFWNTLPEEEHGSSSVKVINIDTFKWGYKAMIEASQENKTKDK